MKRILISIILICLSAVIFLFGYTQYWNQLVPPNPYDLENSPGVAMVYYIDTNDFTFRYDEQAPAFLIARKTDPENVLKLELISIDEWSRNTIMTDWVKGDDGFYKLPEVCRYMSFYATVSFGEIYQNINDRMPTKNKHDFSAFQGASCKPTLPVAGKDLIQLID